MTRSLLGRAAVALLLTAGVFSASAEAGVVIDFSASDNFGAMPSDLTATITLTEVNNVGSGGTLTIEVQNQSSLYSLADLHFNAANAGTMSVTSLTTDQASGGPVLANTVVTGDGSLSQHADGYNDFGYVLDWGNNASDRLAAGNTATFTVTYTGTISDADLQQAVNASPGDGRTSPNEAVLHFYGPTTGFAGSGTNSTVTTDAVTPEPSTIWGAGFAALVAIGYGWRRRGKAVV